MRKTSLLLALAFGTGAAFAQSQRIVLVEEFTQASCGPCASANPAFNTLLDANPTKVIPIKYQVSWPGTDPMNAQNPTEVATRVSYYGVSGVPYAVMDGNVVQGAPSSVTQSNINTEYAVASPFAIVTNFWFNTAQDSIWITCEVTATQATSLTTGRLRVVMIEKNINFTSPPGSNGEKDFYEVFRKAYPNMNGTPLATSWTNGQKKTVSFKAKIPTYVYKKSEIAIVAWVQDDSNKNVKQAAWSPSPGSPSATAPVADFSSDVVSNCDGIVNFKDESALFPTSWLWDFGDGKTSTAQNPTHKYLQSGTYTVKLTATNANGNNQATKTSYITVTLSGTAPTGVNDNICLSGVANLSATPAGSGTLNWYNSQGALVNTGNTYNPTVTGTTNFYVSEMTANPVTTVGAASKAIGTGAYFTANNTHGLYFNVAKPCTLQTVDVDAGAAGNRTIDVMDANGVVIQSVVKNIPNGASTVTLNFPLPAGNGFLIKISSATVNLWRNDAGAVYPYTTSVVTITGSTAASNPTYYYYFYNWKVQQNPCSSPAVTVTAVDSCSATGINDTELQSSLNVFPNPGNGIFDLTFNASSSADYQVTITNAMGQVVYEENVASFSGAYARRMDVTSYGKGVYMLTVSAAGQQVVRKVITY